MKIGFPGLLTLLFVVAKVTGYINWSWWLVFSPLIASAVLGLLVLSFALYISVKH